MMRFPDDDPRHGQRVAPRHSARATASVALVLGVWLAVVIFAAIRHEFWRDEVRALTLARAADTPFDLYAILKYEGHPVLWYLLLHLGTSIADTPLVLPIASIVIAFAAVALFMIAAPFPFWFRGLFVFNALPLYEYSVMARNYGISMLLLFTAAVLYRRRRQHPLRLAVVLALLANTNVHSAVLVGVMVMVWLVDAWTRDSGGSPDWRRAATSTAALLPALAIVAAGLLLCALFVMPRENTSLTPVRQSLEWRDVGDAIVRAATRPHRVFPDLFPPDPSLAAAPVFGLAVLGLIGRPPLLAAAGLAQVLFGLLFLLVYPGWYRHQGLFLLFLVFLYWLRAESAPSKAIPLQRRLFAVGFYVSVIVLVAWNVVKLRDTIWADLHADKSASRRLGEFLRKSHEYRDAILVPEPDFAIEALPYYAGNRIYLARESRFGRTVSWTTDVQARLTLGELLAAAQKVRRHADAPVLIVLGPWDLDQPGERRYLYGTVFVWGADDVSAFRAATEPVAVFDVPHGDEAFAVYAVR